MRLELPESHTRKGSEEKKAHIINLLFQTGSSFSATSGVPAGGSQGGGGDNHKKGGLKRKEPGIPRGVYRYDQVLPR